MPFTANRVLITGASSGIGAATARAFAARGSNLVLVARRVDRLEELAHELEAAHKIQVAVLPFDLSQSNAGEGLKKALGDTAIDAVVNNAGFGTYGDFANGDAGTYSREIAVNIQALVSVTNAFLPGMVAKKAGAIVNIASTGSYQPVPGMAVYSATKSFVRSFTEAVWFETRDSGVKVLAVNPGATRTEFFDAETASGSFATPEQVVETMLSALDKQNTPPSVVSGASNRFNAFVVRFMPRKLVMSVAGRVVASHH